MATSKNPLDIVDKLLSNHLEGKPLLDGAKLYRGSRLPDQSLGTFGEELHTSLLPQVAASYTHNWKELDGYIGGYAIDREKTRFYPDYGMEKTGGGSVKSYSVGEVETALKPLVDSLAAARTPADRNRAESRIESILKTSFYEAGVPAKAENGATARPAELYVYTGRPDIRDRRAVALQMKPLTAETEKTARQTMLSEHKSPEMQAMVALLATRNKATPAIAVVLAVARQDHTDQLARDHGTKSLSSLMTAIERQSASPVQERLSRFSHALNAGVTSADPAIQQKAASVADAVGQLDPTTAKYADLAVISKQASTGLAPSKQVTASSPEPGKLPNKASSQGHDR